MRQTSVGRLAGAWSLVTVLTIVMAILWIRPDVMPSRANAVLFKLTLLLAALSATCFAFVYAVAKSWSAYVRRLQEFLDAPLDTGTDFPQGGPPELESLSLAIKVTTRRIRQVRERANLESSRREAILTAMADGVLAVNENLNVVFCNNAFAQAFGTHTPVEEGRTLYEVVREPALRELLDLALRSDTGKRDRFQLPSAAGRWFEARAVPLEEGPTRGAVVVLHDITDRQHQEQLRKDFVADVSHELRTPLAAIRGYAETLLDGALEDKNNNRKFVEIILAHTIRLNNIASDLLVLSELDSGNAPGPPEDISLPEVVESAMHTIQSEAALRRVHLHRGKFQECRVRGYRFRLEQALVNLLDNAVKFNRPDGEVIIECGYTDAACVRIAVRDTGIGIASEDLKRIFQRFYRVEKARSRTAGGTGLGLPIVKEVVERMGGSVEVESQLGRGSTFTILLQAA